ncbi:amino acid adenylation domain-containing protein [Chitinivorax tropicus]|uniref:Amino acid adenylation domain-containing protein n=2 Tax=Chitinivorax tropicus TaxID=714531 RepID=A0A840MKZ9_9PROT|nr:amino acid adenylation domain-containing protein [Chitinivorax tropicus]
MDIRDGMTTWRYLIADQQHLAGCRKMDGKLNTTTLSLAHDQTLPDLLRAQALAYPERVAVVHDDQEIGYRELVETSEQVSSYLRHLGIKADGCVGIFVDPSVDLLVSIWGVLFAGGAYLPLSPEYPEERLRYMIDDAKIQVIFTQQHLKAKLAELAPSHIQIATMADVQAFTSHRQQQSQPHLAGKHDLAYVIYTSGSTGKPKGVMIEHHSIASQMRWLQATYQLGGNRAVLQKTPMSFDAAQWEILAPAVGCRVVMGNPGIYRDPEALVRTILRHQVTTLQCVPTLLQALLETDGIHDCTSLTQIFSGGEILSRQLARQCLDTLPNCALVNLYGPTECTINASAFTVRREQLADGPHAISIGTPVKDTQYYILDEAQQPVAEGEPGELYIGGIQLARGYLHRPELTTERFVDNPFDTKTGAKLYRTGDLVTRNEDGTVHFLGRVDRQVKLRGFRVELDEIRLAIEAHDWVKNAAVLIKQDPRTSFQHLIACIELNAREAALMDQGNHGAHHQSKESRLQVRAQLANLGCRDEAELAGRPVVSLAGYEPTETQRRRVFARKTYRFYEGGPVQRADVLRLLDTPMPSTQPRSLDTLSWAAFGEILRYFGQYLSTERLLPKYGYASPGALYATQMYLELSHIGGLQSGYYYYHPIHHQLVLIQALPDAPAATARVHFIGKKRAIEPVYKNNIQEVLEFETGHMLGLFDLVLPAYGLAIDNGVFQPEIKASLACAEEDYYLGSFAIRPDSAPVADESLGIYVQVHPGKIADLAGGMYRYQSGQLTRISDELIQKKHVIAINQQVYENASFGIAMTSHDQQTWRQYIALGRKLQHLQMNDQQLGFMSSGYSSKTGNDLPAAKRLAAILTNSGEPYGSCYFCLGGRVSDEQIASEGMKEDTIHMKGPAELIREDLLNLLPDYMMPNRIVVMDQLPQTANGKIDQKALESASQTQLDLTERPMVAPRTGTEIKIADIWKQAMKWDAVSVQDDFFESGGNSLIAVSLINKINKTFQATLPLQILFEASTIEKLAERIDRLDSQPVSRMVPLATAGNKPAIFCWPGLGGYPMNLRTLANRTAVDRPFYGVQAHGINAGETPYATIREMALQDIKAIKQIQPTGPYTLWGYSFGARVAFEVAYQLEQAGERVEHLFLLAPGSPELRAQDAAQHGQEPSYTNKAFVTILFSVFAHSITSPALDECLRVTQDEASFTSFICARYRHLEPDLVQRISQIVRQTFEFKYSFNELLARQLNTPITLFKAQGDDYSFIENNGGYSTQAPTVIELEADHYSMLKTPDLDELVDAIHRRLNPTPHNTAIQIGNQAGDRIMPHINIKHFPVELGNSQRAQLVDALTKAVQTAFGCEAGVISIALEPVTPENWSEQVYDPEIKGRQSLLCKHPSY